MGSRPFKWSSPMAQRSPDTQSVLDLDRPDGFLLRIELRIIFDGHLHFLPDRAPVVQDIGDFLFLIEQAGVELYETATASFILERGPFVGHLERVLEDADHLVLVFVMPLPVARQSGKVIPERSDLGRVL